MTRTLTIALGIMLLAAAGAAPLQDKREMAKPEAKAEAKAELPTCPMLDKPFKWSVYSIYDGKPVYFCCKRCKGKFDGDPETYADKAKAQQKAIPPVAVQVTCPGTGKPVNPKMHSDGDHGRVYFCCEKCKAAWDADSAKFQEKLESCYTYQTTCPLMGDPIDPTVSTRHGDRTVYFCCKMCIPKFEKDADKDLEKIDKEIEANKAESKKRHEG
jgi:YHS domain-containing protein